MNKNITAGQASALAAMVSPVGIDELILLVGRKNFRIHLSALDENPKNGPRYTRRNESSVRFMYSTTLVSCGVAAVHAGLFDTTPCGDLTKHANAIFVRYSAYQGNCPGRLLGLERSHDIERLAIYIRGVAGKLALTRSERFAVKESSRYGGRRRYIEFWHEANVAPKHRIEELAGDTIARWLPAIQNIISRLPQAERLAESIAAQKEVSSYLLILDKLHTMTKKRSDEYARWKSGYGAVDSAIMASAGILAYAVELSRRMVGDEPVTIRLRTSADAAWTKMRATLEFLAEERMRLLFLQVWIEDKSGMAKFARETGGMAPDLEVLYHARGSKFTGY